MIVSVFPFLVTVTGTTFVPFSSLTFPTTTLSFPVNSVPSTLTLSFTLSWSACGKSPPTVGSVETSTGFVASFNVNFNALATSTSISLEISPRVTVTLTYFLPCLSVIFPYSIFSSSARSFSFAFTFAFTKALSSTDNSSSSVGSLEIFTESVVLSDKVKSSTFPDKSSRAFFKLANALSTSVCVASSLLYILLASFKAVSYAVFLLSSCSLV